MAKSMRTSISVPPDLKARMDAVAEPVNWSAVACRAFESELAEIVKRKGVRDMKDVIQRLRASKRQSDDGLYHRRNDAGVERAKDKAEALHLERLVAFKASMG